MIAVVPVFKVKYFFITKHFQNRHIVQDSIQGKEADIISTS
ncbi:hypothetical protein [Flexistipes sp.]|nr:hypothetical protein [Flexistipes sp.]